MHLLIPFAAGSSEGSRDALSKLTLPHLGAARALRSRPARRQRRRSERCRRRTSARWRASSACRRRRPAAVGARTARRTTASTPTTARGACSPRRTGMSAPTRSRWPTPTRWRSTTTSRALFAAAAAAVRRRRLRACLRRTDALVCRACHLARAGHGVARPRHRPQRRSLAAREPLPHERCAACRAKRRCCCTRIRSTPQREARGQWPVNSFWLSGCGSPADGARREPSGRARPRCARPALAEDWAAWRDAWQALDAGPTARAAERRRAARR